jgi:glutamate formiminotransferase
VTSRVLECVVNVSEGRRLDVVADLATAAGPSLLDVHRDGDHNRSVLTLGGPAALVASGVRTLAAATVARLDLRAHAGAHPRIGVLDVVPWVVMSGWPLVPEPVALAEAARDAFAVWAGDALRLPGFLYGPERTLPEVRRGAWKTIAPDTGPPFPHPTAGAVAVGARPPLVAYNLWLAGADLAVARRLAADLRGPAVRALGLQVGDAVQVSCNLIDPEAVGPAAVFDAVATQSAVARAELVGLLPARVLTAIPSPRWAELDVDWSRTIEGRLEQAALDGGS